MPVTESGAPHVREPDASLAAAVGQDVAVVRVELSRRDDLGSGARSRGEANEGRMRNKDPAEAKKRGKKGGGPGVALPVDTLACVASAALPAPALARTQNPTLGCSAPL